MERSTAVIGGASIEDLLRSAVVALDVSHGSTKKPVRGTGFFVAPRIVATCGHVVAETRNCLPGAITGSLPGRPETLELTPVPAWYVGNQECGPDLAFLWASDVINAAHVLLSPVLQTNDQLLTYGHPAEGFRGGQSATIQYAGPSQLGRESDGWQPERVVGTPMSGGASGSPILNLRTGAVCGMLCMSDGRGSAHMVGAADILHYLPEEARETQWPEPVGGTTWLDTLTDEQIAASGWRHPGPRLRKYLETAIRAALLPSHPHSESAIRLPKLTDVYMNQMATSWTASLESRNTLPATAIFDQDEHALIFGGPGLGKSSLLRMGLTNLAENWLVGHPSSAVPVRVQAADLTESRSLPQLIAASVETDLSTVGVVDSLPAELFASEPLRGVHWLVLVDGLDDIVDPEARRGVLTKLAGIAGSGEGSPYRFIIASRPLPAEELDQERWIGRRYELQPFTIEQVRQFAEHLLAELGSGAATAAAQRLAEELDRAKLTDIAVVPLMATMLCQLLAIDVDRSLPTGLTGLYEEFVQALAGPQYVQGRRGIYRQIEDAYGPYGPQAMGALRDVLDRSADLIGRLALARHDGATEPAVELLVSWERDTRPQKFPERRWREFLKGILRRSGLLTERFGDFVFVHETICDYLAACAVVADEARSLDAFNQLFYQWQQPFPGVRETWRQPRWRYSYTRFLIALWHNLERSVSALVRLVARGDLGSCEFIVSLLEDGIVKDQRVIDALAGSLDRIASTTVGYKFTARRALELLARIDDRDKLARVMTAASASQETRDRAAVILAGLKDDRGTDRLVALALDSGRRASERLDAIAALDRLSDDRALGLLSIVVQALADQMGIRRACEHIPARLGEERGADLLVKIAVSKAVDPAICEAAVGALVRRGDPRAADLLAATVQSPGIPFDQRLAVLASLNIVQEPRAASVLQSIAGNTALSGQLRLQGLQALARQDDPNVPDLLTALIGDPDVAQGTRAQAVALLIGMRAKAELAKLASSKSTAPEVRSEAIRGMIGLADDSDAETLASYCRDPALGPGLRLQAAETLEMFDFPDAVECFRSIADDVFVPQDIRYRVAIMGAAQGDAQLADAARTLGVPFTDEQPFPTAKRGKQQSARRELFITLSRWPTAWNGHLADETGDTLALPACCDALARSIADPRVGTNVRRAAAAALIALEDPRGWYLYDTLADQHGYQGHKLRPGTVEVCLSLLREAIAAESHYRDLIKSSTRPGHASRLIDVPERLNFIALTANDTSVHYQLRRYAAEILARLGDPRGNEALDRLLSDSSINITARNQVAGSLARTSDSRGTNFLHDVVKDVGLPIGQRRDAARWLRWVGDPEGSRLHRELSHKSFRKRRNGTQGFEYFPELDIALGVRVRREETAALADEQTRRSIQQILAQFSDPDMIRTLLAAATDPTRRFDHRREAIRSLALQGAADELVLIAEDNGCDNTVRCWAAEEAAWLGESRGTDALVSVVGDRSVDSYTRRRAAHFLVRLKDSRGTRLLTELATDPTTIIDARRSATHLLTQLDFVEDLRAFILDLGTSDDARRNAIEILSTQGEEETLTRLRKEPTLPGTAQLHIMKVLHKLRTTHT